MARAVAVRAGALAGAALMLVSGSAWLLFAAWLATPLEPCPLDREGPCERPTAGTLALAGAVVLPGGLAAFGLAVLAVRYALTGALSRRVPHLLLIASASFAIAMVALALGGAP